MGCETGWVQGEERPKANGNGKTGADDAGVVSLQGAKAGREGKRGSCCVVQPHCKQKQLNLMPPPHTRPPFPVP